MTKGRIFDSFAGVVSRVHRDGDGNLTFSQSADVSKSLEDNKKLAVLNDGYNPGRDMRRVASVHKVILLKWLREAGIRPSDFMRHPRAYSKWLERKIYDKDNSFVLTAPHYRNPAKRSNGITLPKVDALSDALCAGRKLGTA